MASANTVVKVDVSDVEAYVQKKIEEIRDELTLDTKALELACEELSSWDCPTYRKENCEMWNVAKTGRQVHTVERMQICTACTVQYYRQKAGEAA